MKIRQIYGKLVSNYLRYSHARIVYSYPRPFTIFCKEYFKNAKTIGCEIGVLNGDNSNSIIKELNPEILIGIDINDTNYINKRFKLLRGKSINNIIKFPDEYFNFIYIDGSHKFKDVINDLNISYKKTKTNGIIGGHDINDFNVSKALFIFCINFGIYNVYIKDMDYWFIKC